MRGFTTVLATELRLATRNVDMVLFGIVFPVATVLLLGFVSTPEAMQLNFAGVMTFGICAAGLMGFPLTLADYRHRKVLKRFRVTPASPASLLMAQALTSLAYVAVSAALTFAVGTIGFGVRIDGGLGRLFLAYGFVTAAIFGLGALVGAASPNAKVAGAIATALYFPMVFVSGVTIPFEILPAPLQTFAQILPMTHGVELMKGVVLGAPWTDMAAPIAILTLTGLAAYAVAIVRFRWE